MLDDVKKLLKVQEKDLEILKCREQMTVLPNMLNDLNNVVKQRTKEVEDAKTSLKETQVAHKNLEIELESKKTTKNKYETQLMGVKTNQEYKALEKEIFGMKTEMSQIEDRILEKMMETDTKNALIKKAEAVLSEVKAQFAQKEQEVKVLMKDAESKLQIVSGEKAELIKDIDAGVFRKYTRILEHVKGQAIVSIVDRTCQGCHTLLTPQVPVDVRREKILVTCDNCSRILYVADDSKSQEASSAHTTDQAGSPS